MNPFEHKPASVLAGFENFKEIYPKAYNKNETDPYTKARIILMNGTEFEANWFSHQFHRHTCNNDLRHELALSRAVEKQQQQKIALLKPCNESPLEHTIAYEQLAVDLTAELAKREKDCNVKKALDFALLEDFDHLYRYANQLEMEQGIQAERLVGRYTEIMPGRPTIAHHRFPKDNVKTMINSATADKMTVLATMIITAAEQQTMNYYMNLSNFATNDATRQLYEEIALVEEEHVTQYGSLVDSCSSWLEMLLWHEYTECYLYWSCYMTETHPEIKKIWEQHFETEVSHLHNAARLLEKYENKHWQQIIPCADFPRPLTLQENIEYVRNILADTVQYTGYSETYEQLENLPDNADFFRYQKLLIPDVNIVPSHNVIERHIQLCGKDYRWETSPNPHNALQDRFYDNVTVGRVPNAAGSRSFKCNK